AVDEKSAEIELEKEATKQTVKALLDQLSSRDQLILQSKYILGLNEEEIAAAVGCKPNSVRMLLCRARDRAKAIGLTSEKGDEKGNG
ncbi:MAG: sigma-70 family RNA polymerase sigma factor, partial [Firmicutes bacterium]|nr:sigma-70 family RNA polymerase sigma factor [Bacillota bacterium]